MSCSNQRLVKVKHTTKSNRTAAPQMCKSLNQATTALTNFVQTHKDSAPVKTLVKVFCAHELISMNYNPAIRKGLKQILKKTPWDNVMVPSDTESTKLASEYAFMF